MAASFRASARVFPTENPATVSRALLNLFPEGNITREVDLIVAEFDSIEHLVQLLTEQKTRYSFLNALHGGCHGDHFVLNLNKQAATVSRVNVVDEPKPLGSIEFSGTVTDPVMYFEKMLDVVGYITAREARRDDRGQSISGKGS